MSEMTAVEFLKAEKRMCENYEFCDRCPIEKAKGDPFMACLDFNYNYPEEAVAVVQKWADEHPIKTRQSEFLKLYPNAKMQGDGVIKICPLELNTEFNCRATSERISCNTCWKDYWLAEVKE